MSDIALPATSSAGIRPRLLLAATLCAVLNFIAFYPGILHHDAWAYFNAARNETFTNWQPPLMIYLWQGLQAIHDGPQPMLLLFVAAYWAGFALYADALRHEGRKLAAWTLAAALFPLAVNYVGVLVKDIGMAVCFLLAAALSAGLVTGTIRWRALAVPSVWLLIVLGAFMRANSLFALPPLLDLAARATWPGWAARPFLLRGAIVCALSVAVAPAHMLADRYVFRADDIKPISQLQIFDLGGITYFTGRDQFDGLLGADFVARNDACYTPRHWDTYGWGGCAGVYDDLKPSFGDPLGRLWIGAIAAEPVAYLQHRFAHFNRFLQFLCSDCHETVFTGEQSGNQSEFTFQPTVLYKAIDWASQAIAHSPLGPPYVWLLVCLAWAWAALGIPARLTRTVTISLALSGAFYALGFLPIGIAHPFRYIFWTMICALAVTPAVVMRVFASPAAPMAYRVLPPLVVVAVIAFREIAVRMMF